MVLRMHNSRDKNIFRGSLVKESLQFNEFCLWVWRTSKNNYYSFKGRIKQLRILEGYLSYVIYDLCSLSLGMDKGLCVPQQKASVALTCAPHQSIWEHVSQERTLRWHQHQFSHLRGNKKSHLMPYLLILFWKSATLQKVLAYGLYTIDVYRCAYIDRKSGAQKGIRVSQDGKVKQTNLCTAWTDYKKAYDLMPHT